jgi:hypothetical protein
MKKITLLTILCLFTAFFVVAQSNDQIIVKKGRYYQNDKKLKMKEIKTLLKSDPESALMLKKSNTIATIGYVTEAAVMIGVMVATGYTIGALGGVAVALPFIFVAQNKFNKAIEIYNSKHGGTP